MHHMITREYHGRLGGFAKHIAADAIPSDASVKNSTKVTRRLISVTPAHKHAMNVSLCRVWRNSKSGTLTAF
jgi:hypothetical protein